MTDLEPYTCLMSVYKNDNPEQLRVSIDSILGQTVPPSEFLIIVDGWIPDELEEVLSSYFEKRSPLFTFIRFEKNMGLHAAMRTGVEESSNSLIMRMDADDYSRHDRAEKQLTAFRDNTDLSLVGCSAYEFIGTPDNVVSYVDLPEYNDDIVKYGKKRNPFRHDAVMYRREAVLNVGNYDDVPYFEDYDLFIRMLGAGYKAYNVQVPLLSVRVSEDFFMRRGGMQYLKHTVFFLHKARREGFFTPLEAIGTFIPRAAVCLMPNLLRDFAYKRLLRSRSAPEVV